MYGEALWGVLLYRLATLAVGLAIVYLGYRLFRLGIYGEAGTLDATWKGARLQLVQAAPGSLFALFGAVVISVTISKGIEVTSTGGPTVFSIAGMPVPDTAEGDVLGKVLRGDSLSAEDRAVLRDMYDSRMAGWEILGTDTSDLAADEGRNP